MIYRKISPFALTVFILILFRTIGYTQDPANFVNPFIGTGGHGHTFPGPTAPFGMVQLSPDTRLEGWDGCGGYHYSDEYIYGFSHTHLSGTGVPDYCDILMIPFTGEVNLNNGANGQKGYRSRFSHDSESASPGYYKVKLEDYGITAELTATTRVGMHSYTFPAGQEGAVLVDLAHRDKVTNSWIEVSGKNEIEGYRGSSAWAVDQRIYFVARFSRPFSSYGLALNDEIISEATKSEGTNVKGWFRFNSADNQPLIVKVGLSATSIENARKNLESEIPGWDFTMVKNSAHNTWNKELEKIAVEGGSPDQKTIFYTALYHSMMSPNIYSDVDGSYTGRDFRIHKTNAFNYYTVFSLWDTYRAFHPLYTIIDQKRTNDFINTFLMQYDQGKLLPVWELSSNETFCMIGYHAVSVIADAYIKGVRGFDSSKALEAMVNSAMQDQFGLKYYKKYGFIPAELEHESVSKTLEYAYDDWCISVMADSLGMDTLRDVFAIRAQSYKHLFDPGTGLMRARYNGGWFGPFDPAEVNFNYTEANAWQYSFYVPQDMTGFIARHGGKDKTATMLDSLFTVSSVTTGRDQSDITGLIGQYAHGNEPSHHIAYLYNYCGQPWKTQEKINFIMHNFYTNQPDGLIGNEDCGQMSAWAVFSSLGFYPVCPGNDQYAIGTPLFEKSVINLENGKKFIVSASNLSEKNFYIQKMLLNGKAFDRSYLNHSEIMNGGELIMEMGSSPATGTLREPATSLQGQQLLPAPWASPSDRIFRKGQKIVLHAVEGAEIAYTTDGSEPGLHSVRYTTPIQPDKNTTIRFNAWKKGFASGAAQQAEYTLQPTDLEMISVSAFANQYSGSGKINLIDGLKGSSDYRLGGWQGFQGIDVEAQIKIGNERIVTMVSAGFLQDINSWIFMPKEIVLLSSPNGIEFREIKSIVNDFPAEKWGTYTREYIFDNLAIKDRYLKVIARNSGLIPAWHPASGNTTWIFADEISIGYKTE